MQLAAIILARVIGYVEISDLNPRGRVFFPDLVRELVQHYKFQKFPQTMEEFDEQKGVEFHEGKAGDIAIVKFTIFNTILVLETRSNTSDSKRILEEMLIWGNEKFGLEYRPEMIRHFAYVSDLTFYSDVPLLHVSRALSEVAKKTSVALSEIWGEAVHYEPINMSVGHDPTARKFGIAPFSITRRSDSPFPENKYFSEAPLPTDVHIKLLQEFETEMAGMANAEASPGLAKVPKRRIVTNLEDV